jgi:hypothetical protein
VNRKGNGLAGISVKRGDVGLGKGHGGVQWPRLLQVEEHREQLLDRDAVHRTEGKQLIQAGRRFLILDLNQPGMGDRELLAALCACHHAAQLGDSAGREPQAHSHTPEAVSGFFVLIRQSTAATGHTDLPLGSLVFVLFGV